MTRWLIIASMALTACTAGASFKPDTGLDVSCIPPERLDCVELMAVPLEHEGVNVTVPICLRYAPPPDNRILPDPQWWALGSVCVEI